jgi:hypothetical protein
MQNPLRLFAAASAGEGQQPAAFVAPKIVSVGIAGSAARVLPHAIETT